MLLWSRAGQCHSEVPGKCTARCESLLNSSIHFSVHLSSTRQPVPYCRIACRCPNEEPARQGGVVWFFFLKFKELSSFPVNAWGDMAQPSLSLGEILAFLKSKKSKKSSLFSFRRTRISTTYVSVPCSFRYGKTEVLEITWIFVAM